MGRARAQGIEVEAGKAVFEGGVLRAVYAFIDTQDRTPGAANQGNRLARRPRHAVTLSGDIDTDPATPFGLRLGFDLRYVSASFDDAGNTVRLDDYAVFDLRASRALLVLDEASQQTLELFARIENVFDADYQTAAAYAQAGRGVFGGLRARF